MGYLGVALAWLLMSPSVRRSGLLGEVLRDLMRSGPVRPPVDLGRASKLVESALYVRLSPEGDRGTGDIGAVGDVAFPLAARSVEYREGLDGERDSERRICLIVAKPSICGLCGWLGDSICMEPPAEWRGEYSSSIARRWAAISSRGSAPGCVSRLWARR